jgi:hypothetical protein
MSGGMRVRHVRIGSPKVRTLPEREA